MTPTPAGPSTRMSWRSPILGTESPYQATTDPPVSHKTWDPETLRSKVHSNAVAQDSATDPIERIPPGRERSKVPLTRPQVISAALAGSISVQIRAPPFAMGRPCTPRGFRTRARKRSSSHGRWNRLMLKATPKARLLALANGARSWDVEADSEQPLFPA